jgi:hypothetical protein
VVTPSSEAFSESQNRHVVSGDVEMVPNIVLIRVPHELNWLLFEFVGFSTTLSPVRKTFVAFCDRQFFSMTLKPPG